MTAPPARSADRELCVETVIGAAPDRVWAVVTDLKQMREGSPELLAMLPLKPGGLRTGQWYLGLNRRKGVVWPTRSVVRKVEPGRTLTWDTLTSGARWSYDLARDGDGTRLTHRRDVPRRIPLVSRLFAAVFLGGVGSHCDELERGMAATVARLKQVAEDAGRSTETS